MHQNRPVTAGTFAHKRFIEDNFLIELLPLTFTPANLSGQLSSESRAWAPLRLFATDTRHQKMNYPVK
jgi:hypothetical protein